ncbi:MAG: helix-turn-helix domain-containing protein [Candidatus Competibacter sp.]
MNEPYLTIQDIAVHWKISVPTVRRMIARGEVSPVRIGRAVRIEHFERTRRYADHDWIRV